MYDRLILATGSRPQFPALFDIKMEGLYTIRNRYDAESIMDYIQPGNVLYYNSDGTFISTQKAGIIPGMMCFKLDSKVQTK